LWGSKLALRDNDYGLCMGSLLVYAQSLQVDVLCEDTTLNPPIFPSVFFPALGVFWIFVIWVLWKIVQSLRGIDESLKSADASLKEISGSLKNKS